jgi:hypothetical protein
VGKAPPRLESEYTLGTYPDRPEAEGSAVPGASAGASASASQSGMQASGGVDAQGGTRQTLAVRRALVRPSDRG